MKQKLSISDHSRDIAGLKYVYPVLSRRAGGLSIGINVNTNNACNWRCVYCQVPDLERGAAPEMDLTLLETEFRFFLNEVINGNFFNQFEVPESQRVIKDIAISGNGEPTSLSCFDQLIQLVGDIATEMHVLPNCHFVLITNGSLIQHSPVQKGLKILNDFQGEVWYKMDSATDPGRKAINGSLQTNKKTLKNLQICSNLCKTVIQTCVIQYFGNKEEEEERRRYLQLLKQLKQDNYQIHKIMLYTLARPSLQAEASQLKKVDVAVMTDFSEQLRQLGYEVSVNL